MASELKLTARGVPPAARPSGDPAPARTGRVGIRWDWFLVPAVFVSLMLLALPQGMFIWLSFHADLGLGQVSNALTIRTYVHILTDPFYRHAFWLTLYLSVAAAGFGLLLGFPTAYALARIGGWTASFLISLILTTSLVTVVVKLMGLDIILEPTGMINRALLWLGVVRSPVQLLNNQVGVLIGLVQYTLPMTIVLLFGVIQTIPVSLEEAAATLGASHAAIHRQVILPNAMPGMVSSGLIAFNMSMGAFTSAVLLGGGRVRTIPVLIQQIIIQNTDYAEGAALSTVLVVFVFVINLCVGAAFAARGRRAAYHVG